MEKIILGLIIFGIGLLYDFYKQSKEKKRAADSADMQEQQGRQAAVSGMFSQFFNLTDPTAKPQSAPQKRKPKSKPAVRKAPAVPRLTASLTQTQVSEKPTAEGSLKQTFLPGELLEMPKVAEDAPMEITEPETVSSPAADANTDKALAEHYARWRQAIIDTTIITPKFDRQL